MKVRELYEAVNTGFWLRRDDDGKWLRPATKAEVKAFQKAVKKDMNATITVNGEEVHISKKSGLLARLQKAAVKEGEEVRVKDLLAEGAVSKKSKAVERLLKKKGFPAKVDVKGGLLTVKSSQAGAEQAVLLLKQMGLKAFVSKLIGNHGGGLTHQATLSLSGSGKRPANEDIELFEGHGLSPGDLSRVKRLADEVQDPEIKRILRFLVKSNVKVDATRDVSKKKPSYEDIEDISEDYRRRIQNEEQFEKPNYKADFHAGFKAGKKALLKDPYAPLPKREPKGHGITWKDGFNAAIAMSRGLHALEVYKTAKNQGLSQERLIDNRGRVIEDVQPIASEILESLKMDWPAAASSVASTQLDKLYDDLNAFRKRHGRKIPSTTKRNIDRALDSLVALNAQLKRAEEGLYQ